MTTGEYIYLVSVATAAAKCNRGRGIGRDGLQQGSAYSALLEFLLGCYALFQVCTKAVK